MRTTQIRGLPVEGLSVTQDGEDIMIHKPKHPGKMIKSLCLEPLGLSVTEAAKALDVARPTLSKLLNGHIGISPEMAIRLSIKFSLNLCA